MWTPTNKELFEDLKYFCEHAGKENLDLIKKINDQLCISKDFNVQSLIEEIYKGILEISIASTTLRRNNFGDFKPPMKAFFSLIKNIMISEDMRFDGQRHLGRYRFQLSMFDYIVNDKPIDHVLD
ncbi:hypothetical protein [Brevibacillus sp. NRS-1366]|uniref:hypothetical protein n=1 Tax=Brevibacillus sp. NRS-1366 TaxID=3233899 RepID=UPI003D192036